jgi:hypothetical protein
MKHRKIAGGMGKLYNLKSKQLELNERRQEKKTYQLIVVQCVVKQVHPADDSGTVNNIRMANLRSHAPD